MAIKTTLWRPDTCRCEIEFTWDDAVSESDRTHDFKRFVRNCEAHAGLTDWTSITAENKAKNKIHAFVVENLSSLAETVVQEDGSTVKQLKRGVAYQWQFDAQRVLNVSFTGLTALQATALQQFCDSILGSKVVKVI